MTYLKPSFQETVTLGTAFCMCAILITIYIQAADSEVTMRSFERKDKEGRRTTQFKKRTAEPAPHIS
jgi:hypothetical protein